RVRPVFFLQLAQAPGCKIKRLIPSRRPKAIPGAHQRIQQAVRMAALHVAFHALGTEFALVERKLLPGLEAHHALVSGLQLNAALLAAKAAVSLDQSFVVRFPCPAARRSVIQGWSEFLLQRFGTWRFSHVPSP